MSTNSPLNFVSASKRFLGIGRVGDPPLLVAHFVATDNQRQYYMTAQELSDWVEQQMTSGFYYAARAGIIADRSVLQTLIESQRLIDSGKKDWPDFPLINSHTQSFMDYVTVAYQI
jgi:hypothetical protein